MNHNMACIPSYWLLANGVSWDWGFGENCYQFRILIFFVFVNRIYAFHSILVYLPFSHSNCSGKRNFAVFRNRHWQIGVLLVLTANALFQNSISKWLWMEMAFLEIIWKMHLLLTPLKTLGCLDGVVFLDFVGSIFQGFQLRPLNQKSTSVHHSSSKIRDSDPIFEAFWALFPWI